MPGVRTRRSIIRYPWNKSDEEFDFSFVDILVKEEYYAKKFTKKDFKCGNVKKIEYKAIPYDGNSGADYVEAFIVVYLKTPGEYQCKKAILRFEKLDFVVEAVFDDDTSSKERLLW